MFPYILVPLLMLFFMNIRRKKITQNPKFRPESAMTGTFKDTYFKLGNA